MSDLVGNPEDRFSRVAAHIEMGHRFKISSRRLASQWNNLGYTGQLTLPFCVNFLEISSSGGVFSAPTEACLATQLFKTNDVVS